MKTYASESINGDAHCKIPQFSYPTYGLTKREYFSAIAMQGLTSNPDWAKTMVDKNDWDDYINRLASGAVEIADKLIEELNKEK